MHEFLQTEGAPDGQFPIPEDLYEDVMKSGQECDKRAKSDIACDHVFDYLESSGYVPQFNSSTCLVFDEDMFESGQISYDNEAKVKEFCSPRDVSRNDFQNCLSTSFVAETDILSSTIF